MYAWSKDNSREYAMNSGQVAQLIGRSSYTPKAMGLIPDQGT